MSENFGGKGYEEYLKALEQNLNKEKTVTQVVSKPPQSKGVYKVVRLRKSVVFGFLAVVIIVIASICMLGGKNDAKTDEKASVENSVADEIVQKTEKISYKFTENTRDLLPENDAKYGIVVNKSTGTVIAARNPHEKAYPASTTKIMTLLVAVENIKDMNDTFTMTLDITDPLYVAKASVAGFLNGEVIGMKDLLYGVILPSGADASMALAIKISGSEQEFVKLMNKKVKDLGLKNTHFDNVTGLHSKQNYSTAYDMAAILDAALSNDTCKEVLSTYQYTTAKTPQNPDGIPLSSTLFSYMYGTEPETATVLGGKTGFVNESGYCIASYGKANESNNEYIVVTLSNSARWPAFYGQIDLYKAFAK